MPLRSTPPPPGVCADFGVLERRCALAGGQGGSWRVGRLVLKHVGRDPVTAEELRWLGTAVESTADVRVAAPVPATDGSWVVGGWAATPFLEGSPAGWRWGGVLGAGRALHDVVGPPAPADVPRPAGLAVGHRRPAGVGRRGIGRGDARRCGRWWSACRRRCVPSTMTSQLVHGDLGGNVLLADGPPAVIDLSPYWRPPGWALAVVAVDALVWSDAEPSGRSAGLEIRRCCCGRCCTGW